MKYAIPIRIFLRKRCIFFIFKQKWRNLWPQLTKIAGKFAFVRKNYYLCSRNLRKRESRSAYRYLREYVEESRGSTEHRSG